MNRTALEHGRGYQVAALVGSSVICAILFFILLYIRLRQSIPQSLPIKFVEVNFGTDFRGDGHVQTYNRSTDSPPAVDVKRSEDKTNPKESTTSRLEKTAVAPVPIEEESKPNKVIKEKPDIASKVESPISVPEKAEPKKIERTTPKTIPAPPKAESVAKVEKIDPNALFKKSSSSSSNGTSGKEGGMGDNNNGDDRLAVGDKGNPEGNINSKQFYGMPGGASSGISLNMAGWGLGSRPQVSDDSDETGKIVFELKVDNRGDIISVRTKETTVSASVVEVYRRAVQKIRLVPKASSAPPISTGTITFIIKSR